MADSSPAVSPFPALPVSVQVAGTSTVVLPAGISAYSSVAKYTAPEEATLVPCGIAVAVSRSAERVKRRVHVAAVAWFLVTPLKIARLSRKSE